MTENWERVVLGTVLANPDQYWNVEVGADDFTAPIHREIWDNISKLANAGKFTERVLIETLRDSTSITEDYIVDLILVSDVASLQAAAENVQEASAKRQIIELGADLINEAKNGERSDDIIDGHIGKLLKKGRLKSKPAKLSATAKEYDARQKALLEGREQYWTPPFPALKSVIDSVEETDFILIAGRPGTGKTSFLRALSIETALRGGKVLRVLLENSQHEDVTWTLAYLSGVDRLRVINPKIQTEEDRDLIADARKRLDGLEIETFDMGAGKIGTIQSIAKRLALQHKLDMIAVDGIYLMGGDSKNQYEVISANMQGLRNLAQQLKTPVFGATQFRRPEKGVTKDPDLEDFLYSGENAARVAISLLVAGTSKAVTMSDIEAKQFSGNIVNGSLVSSDKFRELLVRAKVMKNTGGRTGVSDEMMWRKHTGQYLSLDPEWRSSIKSAFVPTQTFVSVPKPTKEESKWKKKGQ